MVDSVAAQAKSTQPAHYAAFVTGQLEALHADHRAHLEFPGIRKHLPQDEIRRGRREGEAWIADLWTRHSQDLPEYMLRRGSKAKVAHALGHLTRERKSTA